MAENGIEMRKMRVEGDKEMPSNGPSDDLPRPMEWVTRVRRHNGCFSLFLAAMAIAFGLYVMQGIYFEDEKASVEEFAHGGNGDTISNDEKNAKIKEALENAKSKGYASGASAANQGGAFNQFHQPGGGKYPFNKNPSQEDLDKWNLSHPNRPYPGLHNGKRPIGNHGKGAGAFGGRPGANSRPIDKKGNHNITKPGGSSNESNQVACEDLSQYQNWFEAVIKKDDGKKYEILQQLEHDQHAFTQGLTYYDGHLWESTGLYGQSSVRILDPDTANVLKEVPMESALFGEGMTWIPGNKLVQITWKSQRGFIYDAESLDLIKEFKFSSTRKEGWGITWDACKNELIETDGSEFLHFWDPETMREKRKIAVNRLNGKPAKEMNEIEFWRGRVLANIWYEDVLLVINPETGIVEKEYEFSDLWPKSERRGQGADVFNGISVSDHPDVLYVTGKKWNRMFKIKLL